MAADPTTDLSIAETLSLPVQVPLNNNNDPLPVTTQPQLKVALPKPEDHDTHADADDPIAFSSFAEESPSDSGGDAIVPVQPPSIHNQTLVLSFDHPSSSGSESKSEEGNRTSLGTVEITLAIDASPGCGGVAWPAGEVLARYLARRRTLQGIRALELGSGTGFVGIVAGKLGAVVAVTDQAPLLDTMRHNVTLNGLSSRVFVHELNWGDPLPQNLVNNFGTAKDRPFDLILAADCVYFEPAFPLLVRTLVDLVPICTEPDAGAHQPEVLFCYKKRRKADKRFFILLKKHFEWKQVEDDPLCDAYMRDGISLLRLVRTK